jgi:hypothetical protein
MFFETCGFHDILINLIIKSYGQLPFLFYNFVNENSTPKSSWYFKDVAVNSVTV